jgi:hypothetical protein
MSAADISKYSVSHLTKRCTKCGELRALNAFNKHSKRPGALLDKCRACDLRSAPRPCKTEAERLWSHVAIGDADACWTWTASVNHAGYGNFQGTYKLAHRMAWVLANGRDIPTGLVVMHACDNPPCCNPAHLSLGTPYDNARDAMIKGRMRRSVCKRGHAMTDDNVHIKGGARYCRICLTACREAERDRRQTARKDAALHADPHGYHPHDDGRLSTLVLSFAQTGRHGR